MAARARVLSPTTARLPTRGGGTVVIATRLPNVPLLARSTGRDRIGTNRAPGTRADHCTARGQSNAPRVAMRNRACDRVASVPQLRCTK